MATVGDQLLQPEDGWQRIDDNNKNIKYIGTGWFHSVYDSYYNGANHFSNVLNDSIKFSFYGTKLRIISDRYTNRSVNGIKLIIDNIEYNFTEYSATRTYCVIVFEKLDLEEGIHNIEIINTIADSSKYVLLDAIDIDEDGYMIPPSREIGEQLLEPDDGWQRIDDTDSNIHYSDEFRNDGNTETYQTSHHFCTAPCYIEFNFKGTQLRIIGHRYSMYYSDNINVYIDNKLVGNYSEYTNGELYQLLLFSITDLNNVGHSVKLESTVNGINLDAIDIDEDGFLLSEEQYNSVHIKQNNKYYGFSEDNYNAETQMYNEVTIDNINNYEYCNSLDNLSNEITIGNETFKPIDKFSSSEFSIISKENIHKQIVARNSNNALLVANGDIFANKLADNIDSFTLTNATTNNSSIKMAVSFDSGATWKSYDDVNNKFTDLSITIPNKTYDNMTDEEKINFNNAKATISTDGFDSSVLPSIDFNSDDIKTIRFAYVLNQDLIADTCEMSKLSWQFDAKGDMQKMIEGTEVDIKFCNGIVKVVPKIDTTMMITNYNY